MAESNYSKCLKIATVHTLDDEQLIENVIRNYDGSLISVHDAPVIRALAQGLGATFKIVIPEDNSVGFKEMDGNWSGITGMLIRGEADLSGFPLTLFKDKREAVNFTFPMHVSDVTFMATKPEPYSKHFAIFEVFFFEVWVAIGLCIFFMSLLLYFLLKRKETFSTILLESIGCLLEQSYSFQVRQRNTALLLLHWLVGITVLTTSYKAVILSVITVPRMVGIRDIKDLSKAVAEQSVMCMTYVDCATDVWFDSKDERFKSIDECLKRGESEKLFYEEFFPYPHKKAFIATRLDINKFGRDYFLSDDSLSVSHVWFDSKDERFKSIDECLKRGESEKLFYEEFFPYPHKKAFIATRLDINKFGRDYCLSDDSFSVSHHSVLYSDKFCCPDKLGKVVHRIVEAGLFFKLQRDRDFSAQLIVLKPDTDYYDDSTVKPLTLKDFTGAFLVLFIGHFCALFVFIAEIIVKHNYFKTFKLARNL